MVRIIENNIELAESVLESIFGKPGKVSPQTFLEEEELETICDNKRIAAALFDIYRKVDSNEIYSKCLTCSGLENTGCPYHTNHYINESDD